MERGWRRVAAHKGMRQHPKKQPIQAKPQQHCWFGSRALQTPPLEVILRAALEEGGSEADCAAPLGAATEAMRKLMWRCRHRNEATLQLAGTPPRSRDHSCTPHASARLAGTGGT